MAALPPARYFRIVALPPFTADVLALLEAEGFEASPEPFSPYCWRLRTEPIPLGSSLAARFGYIYIQDRSSMLPPLILAPQPGSPVLDLAASPGSKTGLLAQLVGWAGLVAANEPQRERLVTLRANLARANLLQVVTCSYPGEQLPLPQGSWPHILLDPPCSGWGTAEKHPRTLRLWRGGKIRPLITLQRQLLAHAALLLQPGGHLVYSTCTTNPEENEDQMAWAIAHQPLEVLPMPRLPGFTFEEKNPGGLLVNGAASDAQGFFISLLRRRTTAPPDPPPPPAALTAGIPLARADLASPIFDPAKLPAGEVRLFGDKVRFLPASAPPLLGARCRWQGALLGHWRRGAFVPAPPLRCCIPADAPAIVFEETGALRRFLSGTAFATTLSSAHAILWWRSLPLGTCAIRHGRVLLCH